MLETYFSQKIRHSLRTPGHVHAHWNVVFDWHGQKRGRIDLEIGERGRNGSGDMRLAALFFHFERQLFVMGSLASELNLKVSVDGRRRGIGFRQASTHGDQRKLRTACDLNHVEVAVAVPGVKRLDGYSNQEFALARVANTLPFRRVAYTLSRVQWMGHMVSESALLEDPLGVSYTKRSERHER